MLTAALCVFAQSLRLVYLENAEALSYDEARLPGAQVLTGNVRFRHDNALMFCDSAYFYEASNSFDAFGNVRFEQGDTLFGYGDVLYYDGNAKLARLRRHVRLVDKNTTLTTDSLNYDRIADRAWYFDGGILQDDVNTLTSTVGSYISHLNQAEFEGQVFLDNPKFTLTTEVLRYNTETHIADITVPTVIVYDKETTIYTSLGWYNTQTEESMLLNRSRIEHVDGNTLTGDTIFYDKHYGFGRAHHHIEAVDSADHITLYGNYCEMYEDGAQGKNSGFATDSALLVEWSDSVKYTYIHADTLFTNEVPYQLPVLVPKDSIMVDSVLTFQAPDTIWQDTTYQQVRAVLHVRTYREDIQAISDSAIYNSRDSILFLYGQPVAWSDEQQVSAQQITVYMVNNSVEHIHGEGNALAVQQKHRKLFNQMAGKEMLAYIRDQELHMIEVNGNVETIFFPQEEDGAFMGVNRTASSYAKIWVKDQKLERVVFTTATTGVMYPFKDVTEDQMKLPNFFWAADERPKYPGDVFRQTGAEAPVKTDEAPAEAASQEEETPAEEKTTKKTTKKRK